MTVVGTPYYLAPEACLSEPYTSKSDIWALGVIVYELCTLKQPFQADNLLGLVFKIVQEQPEPIPESDYSPELRNLVNEMLTKDPKGRPSAADILNKQDVKTKLAEIMEKQKAGAIPKQKLYKKRAPTIVNRAASLNPDETPIENMTPVQRMKHRKEQEILRKQ